MTKLIHVPQAPDDTPVNGATTIPVSSNWAYDHSVATTGIHGAGASTLATAATLATAVSDHAANFGIHTKVVRKAATETVNNSDAMQNDDELLLALAANEVWHVKIVLLIDSGATPDFKYTLTVPSGATCIGFHIYRNSADVFTAGSVAAATVVNWTGGGAGTTVSTGLIEGIVVCGATAGNLQLQWAQYTANASDTKVLVNSCIIATKLA